MDHIKKLIFNLTILIKENSDDNYKTAAANHSNTKLFKFRQQHKATGKQWIHERNLLLTAIFFICCCHRVDLYFCAIDRYSSTKDHYIIELNRAYLHVTNTEIFMDKFAKQIWKRRKGNWKKEENPYRSCTVGRYWTRFTLNCWHLDCASI